MLIVDYFVTNKEWIFSGVGVFAIGLFITYKFNSKSSESVVLNNFEANPVITVNNHIAEEINRSSQTSEMELSKRKSLTHILFIDDDIKFKIVKILNTAGWVNTKIIKDVDNLDSIIVAKSQILFVDIHGVGNKLDFKDEGLGLALSLKKKYPNKKIIIYSTESKGDRFHEALRRVDTFLSKNADPFEFQQLIEQYSAEILY